MLKLNNMLDPHKVESCYRNVSFQPEKRAKWYFENCNSVLKSTQDFISTLPAKAEQLDANLSDNWEQKAHDVAQKVLDKWLGLLNAEVLAMSNCASSAITGGSGFNERRAQKANKIQDAKTSERCEYERNIEKIILRKMFSKFDLSSSIRSDDPRAIEKLNAKLVFLNDKLESQKLHNKIVKKYGATPECIQALLDADLTPPPAHYRNESVIFWGEHTQNTRAKIKQVQERILKLEKKKDMENLEVQKEGYIVFQHVERDRIGFIFDGKPSSEVMSLLKSKGFKWAPSAKAWQRQWTPSGIFALKQVVAELSTFQTILI